MALSLEEFKGYLEDPNKTPIMGNDGSFAFVDDANKSEAFGKGYRPATPEEIQKELDYKEYGVGIVNEMKAGALGVARGLTFGLSDPIIGAFTGGDVLRKYEEQNPDISMTGEIAGMVAPALLSGGVGAVGLGARLTPAGAAASASLMAEKAIVDKIIGASAAGVIKKSAAKALGIGVGAAGEGALYGVGDYVSRLALEQEPEFTAEGLISSVGSNALLSGAGGAALIGGGAVGKAALSGTGKLLGSGAELIMQKLGDGIKKGTQSISPTLRDKAIGLYSKMSSARTGVPDSEIQDLFKITDEKTIIKDLNIDDDEAAIKILGDDAKNIPTDKLIEAASIKILGNAKVSLRQALNLDQKSVDKILDGTMGLSNQQKDNMYEVIYNKYDTLVGKKKDAFSTDSLDDIFRKYNEKVGPEILDTIVSKTSVGSALGAANDIATILDKIARELGSNTDIYLNKNAIRNFFMFTQKYNQRLYEISNQISANPNFKAGYVYDFIKKERQILDNQLRFGQELPRNQISTINKIKDARAAFKNTLINKDVWGPGIHTIADFNDAASDFLTSSINFKTTFGIKQVNPDGTIERRLDSAKLKTLFKNLSAPENLVKKDILSEMNTSSDKLLKFIHNKSSDVRNILGVDAETALNLMRKDLNDISVFNQLLERERLFGDIKRQAEGTGLMELLPLAGWAGGAFGGPTGVLGAMLLRSGKDPAMEIRLMKKLKSFSDNIHNKINAGIAGLGNISGATVDITAGLAAKTPKAPVLAAFNKEEEDKKFNEYAKLANSLRNDHELHNRNLLKDLDWVNELSPLVANTIKDKADKAAQFIVSKLPKYTQADSLNPNNIIQPSYNEKAKFNRYMRAVDKPLTVFEDMANGVVNAEGIEVLKNLYPAIYQKFYEKTLEHIASGKVGRVTKLKLRSALGITDNDISMYQLVYQQQEKQQQDRKLSESGAKRLIKAEEE